MSKIYNDSVDSQYLPYTFSYGNYVLQRLGRNVPENSVDFILKNEYSDINDYAFAGLITLQQGNTEKANEIAKKEGAQRAACDYISGMSDSYSLKIYKDIFVPKTWSL